MADLTAGLNASLIHFLIFMNYRIKKIETKVSKSTIQVFINFITETFLVDSELEQCFTLLCVLFWLRTTNDPALAETLLEGQTTEI